MKRLGIKHINTKCKPYLGPNFKKLLKDQQRDLNMSCVLDEGNIDNCVKYGQICMFLKTIFIHERRY